MSDISVVGLGSMGASLTRTLLAAGHDVSVWNRSADKAEPLVAVGAAWCVTLADALEASPVVLVCVRDYATTRQIFEDSGAAAGLGGRMLVQLSTGTPAEVATDAAWATSHDAEYLDGAILAAPPDIGSEDCQILIAGEDSIWRRCQPLLQCLGGKLQHTGDKIESAAILDLAWLGQRLGLYMGVFQALELCRASGVDLEIYAQTIAPDDRMRAIARNVARQDFDDPINTVGVWRDAFAKVNEQAHTANANRKLLEFVSDIFAGAEAAGLAELDMAALSRVFSKPN